MIPKPPDGNGKGAVVSKTIYDPCPFGYRVADDELYALFYNVREDQVNGNGLTCSQKDGFGYQVSYNGTTNYFPFSGWKGHDRSRTDRTHGWYNVGNLGDYQDARICPENIGTYKRHRGRTFLIKDSMFEDGEYSVTDVRPSYTQPITIDYANRTSASPVRCVRYPAEYDNRQNK